MSQYSISQIELIKGKGVYNKLSHEIKDILSELSALITDNDGENNHIGNNKHKRNNNNAIEVFNKRSYRGNRNDNKQREQDHTHDDWETVRTSFKTTVIEKKEGIDKKISEIRIALNKFSAKNKLEQTDKIISLIEDVIGNDESESNDESNDENVDENIVANNDANMEKIVNFIFDIASSNGFYSELYAEFYFKLINKFNVFEGKIADIVKKYKDSFDDIVPVDPNTDYDAYCAFVKKNDMRKSMTTFMCHLTKYNVLDQTDLLSIINYIVEKIPMNATTSATSVVEELIDNLFIMITTVFMLYKNDDTFNSIIMPEIVRISKLRKLDKELYIGMTSRATFKCMDLIDFVKKN